MLMTGCDGKNSIAIKIAATICKVLIVEYILFFAIWYGLADGLRDMSGTALGADFIGVYTAGSMANHGQAAMIYDWGAHRQAENLIAGFSPIYISWHYPPIFLMLACLLATLPYLPAFALYMIGTFTLYAAAIRRLTPKGQEIWWIMAAFPGVFTNIINGQNGFLTTGLFGIGLCMLDANPWLAGLFFGLMVYKPQFFILIPIILFIGGYRKTSVASIMTALTAAALSYLIFGAVVWSRFFENTALTQHRVLEQGAIGWAKMQSVFAMIRIMGGNVMTAYAAQTVVGLSAFLITAFLWRKKTSLALRASSLCIAILLATPYVVDYDLTLLAIPLALWLRKPTQCDFPISEKIMLAALWLLPLLARLAGGIDIPLTPPILIGFMSIIVMRRRTEP